MDDPLLPTKPTQNGTTMAFISYISCFVGFPLWIIPMIQKDDAFALYHAKNAAVAWAWLPIGLMLYLCSSFTIGVLTLGIASLCCFPLVFIQWIPMIHGFILVANGKWEAPFLTFNVGPGLFSGLQVQGPKL
jgi:hypothetical protein